MIFNIRHWLVSLVAALFVALYAATGQATVIQSYEFATEAQEQQFFRLTEELRCPQCQNQSIADSNAGISEDLRREVHRMVLKGADDKTVIEFMLDRYGEFILYRPQFESKTLVLWLGPLVLLLFGLFIVFVLVRKHRPSVEDESMGDQERAQLEKLLDRKES
ncbi:MAG: cytochrome c-type biogenesis protein [Endozoicomonas sp.]